MNVWLKRNWFLFVLLAGIAAGMLWGPQVRAGTAWVSMKAMSIAMLFCMSLPLPVEQLRAALGRAPVAGVSLAIGFILPPLLVWSLPLEAMGLDPTLALGLAVAAALPTTLSSAAIWTMLAGGDAALALLCSVSANFACILLTPQVLSLTTGAEVHFSVWAMTWRLCLIVILPTLAGQVVRHLPGVEARVIRRKKQIGLVSRLLILVAVMAGVSRGMGHVEATGRPLGTDLLWTAALAAGLHAVTLAAGLLTGRAMRLRRPQGIALAFASSQKSLVIGLYVLSEFEPFRSMGLVILPIVLFHPIQLVIDSCAMAVFKHPAEGAGTETPAAVPEEGDA